MSYTVRFDRGNRWWTCSVFRLGANGLVTGAAVASGNGPTRDEARAAALAASDDAAIRAALTSSDSTRPYWVQGAVGEQLEAQRKAAASEPTARKRAARK